MKWLTKRLRQWWWRNATPWQKPRSAFTDKDFAIMEAVDRESLAQIQRVFEKYGLKEPLE